MPNTTDKSNQKLLDRQHKSSTTNAADDDERDRRQNVSNVSNLNEIWNKVHDWIGTKCRSTPSSTTTTTTDDQSAKSIDANKLSPTPTTTTTSTTNPIGSNRQDDGKKSNSTEQSTKSMDCQSKPTAGGNKSMDSNKSPPPSTSTSSHIGPTGKTRHDVVDIPISTKKMNNSDGSTRKEIDPEEALRRAQTAITSVLTGPIIEEAMDDNARNIDSTLANLGLVQSDEDDHRGEGGRSGSKDDESSMAKKIGDKNDEKRSKAPPSKDNSNSSKLAVPKPKLSSSKSTNSSASSAGPSPTARPSTSANSSAKDSSSKQVSPSSAPLHPNLIQMMELYLNVERERIAAGASLSSEHLTRLALLAKQLESAREVQGDQSQREEAQRQPQQLTSSNESRSESAAGKTTKKDSLNKSMETDKRTGKREGQCDDRAAANSTAHSPTASASSEKSKRGASASDQREGSPPDPRRVIMDVIRTADSQFLQEIMEFINQESQSNVVNSAKQTKPQSISSAARTASSTASSTLMTTGPSTSTTSSTSFNNGAQGGCFGISPTIAQNPIRKPLLGKLPSMPYSSTTTAFPFGSNPYFELPLPRSTATTTGHQFVSSSTATSASFLCPPPDIMDGTFLPPTGSKNSESDLLSTFKRINDSAVNPRLSQRMPMIGPNASSYYSHPSAISTTAPWNTPALATAAHQPFVPSASMQMRQQAIYGFEAPTPRVPIMSRLGPMPPPPISPYSAASRSSSSPYSPVDQAAGSVAPWLQEQSHQVTETRQPVFSRLREVPDDTTIVIDDEVVDIDDEPLRVDCNNEDEGITSMLSGDSDQLSEEYYRSKVYPGDFSEGNDSRRSTMQQRGGGGRKQHSGNKQYQKPSPSPPFKKDVSQLKQNDLRLHLAAKKRPLAPNDLRRKLPSKQARFEDLDEQDAGPSSYEDGFGDRRGNRGGDKLPVHQRLSAGRRNQHCRSDERTGRSGEKMLVTVSNYDGMEFSEEDGYY